jgi:hypothetical protein
MRFVMRSLVVLTFPIVVFGWLSSAQLVPAPSDWDGAFPPDPVSATAMFVIGGLILVVAGSLWLTLADLGRALPLPSAVHLRPVATPVVVVATYLGGGTVGMAGLYLDPSEKIGVWLQVATAIAGGFVALLAATVMIRALVGLWSRPDLAMWPGRRVMLVLLLLVAVSATPVRVPHPPTYGGFNETQTLVPLGERAWIELPGGPALFWRYTEDGVNGLL